MLSTFKRAIQKFANLFGYEISRTPTVFVDDPVVNNEFDEIYSKYKNYTLTSKERMYAVYKAVEYTVNAKIPGEFVECGVWKGGIAMVIAHTLLKMGETQRKIYLYDTFEGMSSPASEDYLLSDKTFSAESEWKEKQKNDHNEWCFSSLSEVKRNVFSTGYPKDNWVFVKGKVEETIPSHMPPKIALLRLDTDWYESTKHELNHLYPILAQKGVFISDDYGHWAGAKKAIDEYFGNNKIPILLNRTDYTGRIGIKL